MCLYSSSVLSECERGRIKVYFRMDVFQYTFYNNLYSKCRIHPIWNGTADRKSIRQYRRVSSDKIDKSSCCTIYTLSPFLFIFLGYSAINWLVFSLHFHPTFSLSSSYIFLKLSFYPDPMMNQIIASSLLFKINY